MTETLQNSKRLKKIDTLLLSLLFIVNTDFWQTTEENSAEKYTHIVRTEIIIAKLNNFRLTESLEK